MAFSEPGQRLYEYMRRKGYPEGICRAVAGELQTEYTARRMEQYLSHGGLLPMEAIADELLAILAERDAIVRKKEKEFYQHGVNQWLNSPLRGKEENEERVIRDGSD